MLTDRNFLPQSQFDLIEQVQKKVIIVREFLTGDITDLPDDLAFDLQTIQRSISQTESERAVLLAAYIAKPQENPSFQFLQIMHSVLASLNNDELTELYSAIAQRELHQQGYETLDEKTKLIETASMNVAKLLEYRKAAPHKESIGKFIEKYSALIRVQMLHLSEFDFVVDYCKDHLKIHNKDFIDQLNSDAESVLAE